MIYTENNSCLVTTAILLTYLALTINTNDDRVDFLYSHGLAETKQHNDAKMYLNTMHLETATLQIPEYDDCALNVRQLTLYTKNSVKKWCQAAKELITTNANNTVHAFGRSCGAGTLINGLYFLCNYDNNVAYFKDTGITKGDAHNIISAINKGSLTLHVPFLALQKTHIVSSLSLLLSYCTLGAACYFITKMIGISAPLLSSMICMIPCKELLHLEKPLKKLYSYYVIPRCIHYIISKSFDPNHITPLEALKELQHQITCPVFIHIAMKDEILNPGKYIIPLYDTFNTSSAQTSLIISTNDLHDDNGDTFMQALKNFYRPQSKDATKITSDKIIQALRQKPSNLHRWYECIKNVKARIYQWNYKTTHKPQTK